MARSTLHFLTQIVAAGAIVLAGASDAVARGGGGHGGGHGGGPGVGPRGPFFPNAGYGTHFGRARSVARRNWSGGRYAFGGYGYGYGYGEPSLYGGPAREAPSAPAYPSDIRTTSVVIHRGPAFGEPGYYSHPVIYRLVPERAVRPGTRRFRVEKSTF